MNSLVPKRIIDKNGVRRTVHVNPEKEIRAEMQRRRVAQLESQKRRAQERERLIAHCSFPTATSIAWDWEGSDDPNVVKMSQWLEDATPADVFRIVNEVDEDDEPILDDNKIYAIIVEGWGYMREDTRYYLTDNIMRSERFVSDWSDSPALLEALSGERKLASVLAVDPNNCGCTECIVGEYVPFEKWQEEATAADVANFVVDNIKNNTYFGTLEVALGAYSDGSVYRLMDSLRPDMARAARSAFLSSDEAVSSTRTN